MKPKILLRIFLTSMLALALIIACGGGGGGGDGTSTTPAGQTGSVAVLVTDAPAGAEEIWIKITEVTLIPPEYDGNRKPVVIYTNPQGLEIDLLEYQDGNHYMLKLATDVPAGEYAKIRLGIKDVRVEGSDECDDLDIKLPSGRIDVNPRGTFEVIPGETLLISLDVDAEKSINLHRAGKSGKCIFRPVVFAGIKYGYTPPKLCPEILSGTISTVFSEGYQTDNDDNDSDERIGFHLLLNDKRGRVEVILSSESVVYNGEFLGQAKWRDTLEAAILSQTPVKVRGKLNSDARLEASVVVIGEILDLKGVVSDEEPINYGDFIVDLDTGQALSPTVEVILDDDNTLVLSGCDQPFEGKIEAGMQVRLFGQYDTENEVLNAVAVLVKLKPVAGQLEFMEQTTGGYNVSILTDEDPALVYFLPETASVFVGSAKVKYNAWEDLASRIVNCRDAKDLLEATLKLDPEAFDPSTVSEMKIKAEMVAGKVETIYRKSRKIKLDDGTLIKIVDDPIIHKNSSSSDLDDIYTDDDITAYGLFACEEDTVDFFAYIVLTSDDDDDDDYDD